MTGNANVRSIPVIREFRGAVQLFLEEAQGSLDAIAMEMQRAFAWVEEERPHYWERQSRRAFDQVAQARSALHTCTMRTVADHRPSCIEEKQALAAAKRRLEHCQEQMKRVQKWAVKIRHEADEFRGRLSGLRRLLENDLPELLAQLDQAATALEAYADITAPPPT
ncbi:MAG: hypothetical protein R3C01_13375 [Planctomycetaceae bacterium]